MAASCENEVFGERRPASCSGALCGGQFELALLRLNAAGAETPQIPDHERLLSAGAALQNMLLQASALGLGSSLTSGQALQSAPLRHLFGLADDEMALCFVSIGHVVQPRAVRERPAVDAYFSRLAAPTPS